MQHLVSLVELIMRRFCSRGSLMGRHDAKWRAAGRTGAKLSYLTLSSAFAINVFVVDVLCRMRHLTRVWNVAFEVFDCSLSLSDADQQTSNWEAIRARNKLFRTFDSVLSFLFLYRLIKLVSLCLNSDVFVSCWCNFPHKAKPKEKSKRQKSAFNFHI